MNKYNIYKKKLIYKSKIGLQLMLCMLFTLLSGFSWFDCGGKSKKSLIVNRQVGGKSRDQSMLEMPEINNKGNRTKKVKNNQDADSNDSNATLTLGRVGYFKMYPNFGFITIDPSFQDKHPESKNVRLLFYASNHIQDCVRMHFSNQGVALSYVNTSTESINHFIEVDAELFDGLLKAETVELCKVDSLDRLEATCGTDFTIFSITDYGVKLIDHNYNIVLLGDMQNPSKYQDINYMGFMRPKSSDTSAGSLCDLVNHLMNPTDTSTKAIVPALVSGHSLKPATTLLGGTLYGYIKNAHRYRLIALHSRKDSFSFNAYGPGIDKKKMPAMAQPEVAVPRLREAEVAQVHSSAPVVTSIVSSSLEINQTSPEIIEDKANLYLVTKEGDYEYDSDLDFDLDLDSAYFSGTEHSPIHTPCSVASSTNLLEDSGIYSDDELIFDEDVYDNHHEEKSSNVNIKRHIDAIVKKRACRKKVAKKPKSFHNGIAKRSKKVNITRLKAAEKHNEMVKEIKFRKRNHAIIKRCDALLKDIEASSVKALKALKDSEAFREEIGQLDEDYENNETDKQKNPSISLNNSKMFNKNCYTLTYVEDEHLNSDDPELEWDNTLDGLPELNSDGPELEWDYSLDCNSQIE